MVKIGGSKRGGKDRGQKERAVEGSGGKGALSGFLLNPISQHNLVTCVEKAVERGRDRVREMMDQ